MKAAFLSRLVRTVSHWVSQLVSACAVLVFALTVFAVPAHAQLDIGPGAEIPTAPPPPPVNTNNALFDSQSVPTTMETGKVYSVSVRMRNTGENGWTSASEYFLGSLSPQNNYTWGLNRVSVGYVPVEYWTVKTFAFQVTAPPTPGTYIFHWGMVQEDREWFGTTTPPVTVTVVAPAPVNNAQVVSASAPSSMQTGLRYNVSVTMRNTGTTTWRPSTHLLGAQNPHDNRLWLNGSNRVPLGATVSPGQQYQFNFSVVAPAAGTYSMQWRMVEEDLEWFGGTSSNAITVSNAPAQPRPTIQVTRTPSPMKAGQPFTLVWQTTNATSLTRVCSASGTGFTSNGAMVLNDTAGGTASAAWVNYPSTCVWTATGAGGTATATETMRTEAAAAVGGVVYIHTDGLGSPVMRTDGAGGVVSRTRYEPYGYVASGATPTIGFTGHVNDGDTGLTYMQQRYYDPVAGRFLSVDPVMTDGNTGTSFNRFNYANNNPYKYIDPDGRDSEVTWNPAGTAVKIKIPFAISDPAGVARFTSSQVAAEVANRLSGKVVIDGVAVSVTTTGVPVSLNSDAVRNGSANIVTVRPTLGRSSTNKIGGNRINLRGTADAKVVTHELAHSAKAGDQYPGGVDASGKVIPATYTPTTNNIMGDGTGTANAQTLREMAGPRPPSSLEVSKDF